VTALLLTVRDPPADLPLVMIDRPRCSPASRPCGLIS
jgi:hypothetical protein